MCCSANLHISFRPLELLKETTIHTHDGSQKLEVIFLSFS